MMREVSNVLYIIYLIFSYIPNARFIIKKILSYIAQLPKRVDVLIVDIYMNITKEV